MREHSIVRNPLTVIAIFAGIAEVSGTTVLPILDKSLQATFMWFVMGFPCALVGFFFVTLIFKHEVLYAPSDFRDDSSFLSARVRSAARDEKRKEDLAFVESEIERGARVSGVGTVTPAAAPGAPKRTLDVAQLKRTARGTYFLAERMVMDELEKEMRGRFSFESVVRTGKGLHVFDATVADGAKLTAIEIKYFSSSEVNASVVRNLLQRANEFYTTMSASEQSGFRLLFAIATDAPESEQQLIRDRVAEMAAHYSVPVDVRVFDMKELEGKLDRK